jgi:UDP-N-acetylglucosamine transferase subunit ALG13
LILLVLGTEELPFERALDRALPLAALEDMVIQHGATPPREDAAGIDWIRFTTYDRIVELCREASAVVCHAGVGTIMTALGAGKIPLVIPRLAHLGEAVDDHQLQISGELGRRGLVVPLADGDDVRAALRLTASGCPPRDRSDAMRRAVADAVDGVDGSSLRRPAYRWLAGRS